MFLANKKNGGFVLIEMIIYIGLFSILIGGLVVSAFYLINTTSNTSTRVVVQEEMNFVLKKLDWALSDAKDIKIENNILKIKKDSETLAFRLINQTIEFCENNRNTCSNFSPLTSLNVKVETFDFIITDTSPKGVKIDLSMNNQKVSLNKYLKMQ